MPDAYVCILSSLCAHRRTAKLLVDNYDWKNADFERARASGKNASQYAILESSWWEQREWGITTTVDTLKNGGHPLGNIIQDEFDKLEPQPPSLDGFTLGKVRLSRSNKSDIAIPRRHATPHPFDLSRQIANRAAVDVVARAGRAGARAFSILFGTHSSPLSVRCSGSS